MYQRLSSAYGKNLNISARDYQPSVPNLYKQLLHRSDYKITYMTNMHLAHSQRLRDEDSVSYAATTTTSAPIARGTAAITTLAPDAPFSDTPAESSILLSTLLYENPV